MALRDDRDEFDRDSRGPERSEATDEPVVKETLSMDEVIVHVERKRRAERSVAETKAAAAQASQHRAEDTGITYQRQFVKTRRLEVPPWGLGTSWPT